MINLDGLQQSILLVVIERDNFDRMKKADPITLESTQAGGLLPPPSYPLNLSLLIAYEEDQDDLYRRAKKNAAEMLKWLERGRVFIKGVDGKSEAFRIPRDKEPCGRCDGTGEVCYSSTNYGPCPECKDVVKGDDEAGRV